MLRAGGRVAARPSELWFSRSATAAPEVLCERPLDQFAGGPLPDPTSPVLSPSPKSRQYDGMSFYEKHAATLDRALSAIRERAYWSAFNESPSPRVYGEDAAPRGKAAFEAYLGTDFPLDQPGTVGRVQTEQSPFGV